MFRRDRPPDTQTIFRLSWEEHLKHMEIELFRLQDAGLSVKSSKCQFAIREWSYLGHVVGGGKVRPLKDN